MRTAKKDDDSKRVYFWFDPWRYCCFCRMYHDERRKRYWHYADESKDDYPGRYNREDADNTEQYEEYDEPDMERRSRWDEKNGKEETSQGERRSRDSSHTEKEQPDYSAYPQKQTHVHEYEGSTKLANSSGDIHNHRIAGISGEAIRIPGGHVHKIWTRTDFFDHFHYIHKLTGPAVYVEQDYDVEIKADKEGYSEEPHVHFIAGFTSVNDGHNHEFQFATLIESPLLPEEE